MFDYKCTNETLEVEKEFNDSLVHESYDDNEEIKLLKQIDGREEFYELINSDPLYYLKLLETSTELKDVCNDFDIKFYRETIKDGYRNNLRIDFKIRPDDEYTGIGFFSEANDINTYNEFKIIVTKLLARKQLGKSTNKEDEKKLEKEKSRSHLASQLEGEHSMFKELESSTNPFENFVHTMSQDQQMSGYDTNQKDYASFDGSNDDGVSYEITKNVSTVSFSVLEQLKKIKEDLPKEFLNDYDKMLLNIRFNKRNLKAPSKKVFSKLMEVYNQCDDEAIKFEIDYFLYNNNGEKYIN
jgi:hypothetical protein